MRRDVAMMNQAPFPRARLYDDHEPWRPGCPPAADRFFEHVPPCCGFGWPLFPVQSERDRCSQGGEHRAHRAVRESSFPGGTAGL